jgi:hypothetical protein
VSRVRTRAGFDGLLRTDMTIYGVHALPVTWTETAQ